MKKLFILAAGFLLTLSVLGQGNSVSQIKSVKLELNITDAQLVYIGLGKLPSEESSDLRTRYAEEVNAQLADSTKLAAKLKTDSRPIKVTLSPEETDLVLKGLGKLPDDMVGTLRKDILKDARSQLAKK